MAAPASRPDLAVIDRDRVLGAADRALARPPVTLTAHPASRSPGGPNDYYSEADYWWPDPANPSGPYVRRDGYSNPAKFVAHREALIGFSVLLPALAAAWKLTGEARYAEQAERHLTAWFVTPATRMTPRLDHAQAIIGLNTGRGIGVIDTLHLVEVARAVGVLSAGRPAGPYAAVTDWFADYLLWMTTSPNGVEERDEKNNHGTCWALQAAQFAQLTGNRAVTAFVRERFSRVLVPGQIAADGSQPLELARTKPYGYCLFNLDVMATLAQVLALPGEDLWRLEAANGASLAKALAFMAPFIADKWSWPLKADVESFDDWPVRQISLLFGGLALARPDYLALWARLHPDPTAGEIIRNFPIRQPLLWT